MSNPEDVFAEKRLKIILVGDSGVGKTSIALKFCNDEFSRQYIPTSGIDFFFKNVSLGSYKNVNLYLWDISGLSLHSAMLDKYVHEANIILFVYDVTNSSSFDILEEWIAQILEFSNDLHVMPIISIIGNKCDVEHQRTVKRERSNRFATENGFHCHDMSARNGQSVSLCIVNLAAKFLGIRLTQSDYDFYKPIVTAEIGDTVDMPVIHDKKIAKRCPNKKQSTIHHFRQNLPMSKSAACCIQ